MPKKLKYTANRKVAQEILEMLDWNLERSEQQLMVDYILGLLEDRMGRPRGPRVLNTMQVTRLRSDALEAVRAQIIAQLSGPGGTSVAGSFKRIYPRANA